MQVILDVGKIYNILGFMWVIVYINIIIFDLHWDKGFLQTTLQKVKSVLLTFLIVLHSLPSEFYNTAQGENLIRLILATCLLFLYIHLFYDDDDDDNTPKKKSKNKKVNRKKLRWFPATN